MGCLESCFKEESDQPDVRTECIVVVQNSYTLVVA